MADTLTNAPAAGPDGSAASAEKPSGEPKPGAPKPSRFRTDAHAVADPLLNPPAKAPMIFTEARDGAVPRDPATGQFTPRAGDPNAGVIPELQTPQEGAPPVEGPDERGEPAEAPTEPTFTPLTVDLGEGRHQVFNSQTDLNNFIKRMAAAQSAADARAQALVKQMNASLPAQAAPPAEPAAPEFTNPFEKSILDDEKVMARLIRDIEDPDNGPAVAIARIVEVLEKRTNDLVKFILHKQEEAANPAQQFLAAMDSVAQTGAFFKRASEATAQGTQDLLYPEMREGTRRERRAMVSELTKTLHEHNLSLTPANFDLAFKIWKSNRKTPAGIATQQGQPPNVPPNNASAAAVGSGRGARVPDLRADRRPATFREDMAQVNLHRGRFRTEG